MPSDTSNPVLRRSPFLLLTFASVALASACITDPVTHKRKGSVIQLSAEDERALGRQLAPEIEAQFDSVVPDPFADQVLGDLIGEMISHSPRRAELDFEFKILNSSIPNAMALPGGRIYITRGLLEDIHSEAEFVAVMGHEFGHVDHRHSSRVPWSTAILAVPAVPFELLYRWVPVGRRVTGGAAAFVASPARLNDLGFSRRQELEADERGVTFAYEMGYDPRDFRAVFELFDRLEAEGGGASNYTLLRTHPKNKDRIENLDKIIARDYSDLEGQEFRRTSPEVAEVLATFRNHASAYALYDEAAVELAGQDGKEPDKDALQRARELTDAALDKLPTEPLFWILRGEQEIYAENYPAAYQAFLKAHGFYQLGSPGDGHWKPPFYLGLYATRGGEARRGVELLELSALRHPTYGLIHYWLGIAYEDLGQKEDAITSYKQALSLSLEPELAADAKERLADLR